MNRSDDELGRKIGRHLDESLSRLDERVQARLLGARKVALARYGEARAAAGAWAWAGNVAGRLTGHHPNAWRYAAGAVALVAAVAGITYWQSHSRPADELAEIDARILTDDLPINAYLDKGFDSWLKRQSR